MLTEFLEMPAAEQFLNTNIDHLRSRHRSDPQIESHLVSGQLSNTDGTREYAEVDEQHKELHRIQRDLESVEPSLYTFLRYEQSTPTL